MPLAKFLFNLFFNIDILFPEEIFSFEMVLLTAMSVQGKYLALSLPL